MTLILGITLGGLGGAVMFFYLFFTRPLRLKRKLYIFILGYILMASSAIAGALLIRDVGAHLEPERNLEARLPLLAYAITYAIVSAFGLRAEFRWRKLNGKPGDVS